MNNRPHQPLGRGQALQRVMAESINSLNVTEMRMANYTNERIMEVLESIAQRTDVDPLGQNSECRKDQQSRNAEKSTSNADRNRLGDSSSLNTAPGQFTLEDNEFPPL